MKHVLIIALPVLLAGAAMAQTPPPTVPTEAPTAEAALAAPVQPPSEGAREAQALTTLIEGLQAGRVDYRKLERRVIRFVRPQVRSLSASLRAKGAVQTVEDAGVQANGLRQITVTFERDSTTFGVAVNAAGRISGLTIRD